MQMSTLKTSFLANRSGRNAHIARNAKSPKADFGRQLRKATHNNNSYKMPGTKKMGVFGAPSQDDPFFVEETTGRTGQHRHQ